MSLPYRGRFAPSPTGPLHFGSLVAAVGSYLDARTQQGEWLVRIEDVDTPRCLPGAADEILRTLESFGFAWDGAVLWQSQRHDAYAVELARLIETGRAYACACSRKEIAEAATLPAIDGGLLYPGTCRNGIEPGRQARAVRLRVAADVVGFEDRVQGYLAQNLDQAVGDFVLRRADGLWAYQLAVVVDDHAQGITHVVRGADLLDSTPRQIWLSRQLGWSPPVYAHLPVVANAAGEKLSKQTLAPALDVAQRGALLLQALEFLGQNVPLALAGAPLSTIWAWAEAHWALAAVPPLRSISDPRPLSSQGVLRRPANVSGHNR